MRRFIDIACKSCKVQELDQYLDWNDPYPQCKACGGETERLLLPRSTGTVIGDDIPGGLEIRNGLCNADGTPRKYYSHSEIRREAQKRGLVNHVEHQGGRGSDKSPHTVRWT